MKIALPTVQKAVDSFVYALICCTQLTNAREVATAALACESSAAAANARAERGERALLQNRQQLREAQALADALQVSQASGLLVY